MDNLNLLDQVRACLSSRKGAALQALAKETGVKYDTLLRIRDSKTDPPFSKVHALAMYFRLVR